MILRRYLFREIVMTFLGVFVLLLLIFVSRNMVDYLAQAAAGRLPVGAILSLVGLLIVSALSLLVPLCLFIAILFALGRLQRDNEIIAMSSAGMGGRYLHRNVLQLTGVFAVSIAVCSLFFGPWAIREMRDLKVRAEQESDITGMTPGRFKEFSNGDRVFFIRSLTPDKQRMEDIFGHDRDKSELTVVSAKTGAFATEQGTGHKFAVLYDGTRYKGVPGQADYEITQYESLGWRIDQTDSSKALENIKGMPTTRLIAEGVPAGIAELQWRISVPILTTLLSIFAVSLLGLVGPNNRYGALLIAILVYFTYSNLLGVARTMVKKEQLPGVIGLWWVHLIVVAVIMLMEFHPVILRRWREWRRLPA